MVATVVAHMACEVAAEQALSCAFADKGLRRRRHGFLKTGTTSPTIVIAIYTTQLRGAKSTSNRSGKLSKNPRSAAMTLFTREPAPQKNRGKQRIEPQAT